MPNPKEENLLSHQYPPILLKHPRLIKILYFLNLFIHQRNRVVRRNLNRFYRHNLVESVLDLGVGEGAFFVPDVEKYPAKDFTAVDKSRDNIDFLSLYFINDQNPPKLIETSIEDFQTQDQFHLILLIGVLQYCDDDNLVLNKINRLIATNASSFIYIPLDAPDVLSFYQTAHGKYENYEKLHSRKRMYNISDFQEKLESANLNIEKITYTNYTLGKLSGEIYNLLLQKIIYSSSIKKLLNSFLLFFYLPFHITLNVADEFIKFGSPHGVLLEIKKNKI